MKYPVFVLVLCVLYVEAGQTIGPHAEISTECTNHGASGSCDFFWCMEGRFPCGRNGHAVNMLADTCDRANMNIQRFNDMGRRWVNRTAKCVTESLLPVYTATINRCDDIQDAAIDAYLTCRRQVDEDGNDFCTFIRENLQVYQEIFGVQGFGQMFRSGNPRLAGSFVLDVGRCRVGEFQERVNTFVQQVEGIVETAVASIVDRWNIMWS